MKVIGSPYPKPRRIHAPEYGTSGECGHGHQRCSPFIAGCVRMIFLQLLCCQCSNAPKQLFIMTSSGRTMQVIFLILAAHSPSTEKARRILFDGGWLVSLCLPGDRRTRSDERHTRAVRIVQHTRRRSRRSIVQDLYMPAQNRPGIQSVRL